ncbi:fibronectin type III domain-containing protein [Aquimarina sp. Aq78]|uniref:fibronectin type III domain-containing protein n=1 Tax=Aquimarina sp. Aq78 TaxID=1191889 RepID=UPI00131BF6E4|nr:fibronectin type III domain-containing protein [Aquimarina sp. Aq78]
MKNLNFNERMFSGIFKKMCMTTFLLILSFSSYAQDKKEVVVGTVKSFSESVFSNKSRNSNFTIKLSDKESYNLKINVKKSIVDGYFVTGNVLVNKAKSDATTEPVFSFTKNDEKISGEIIFYDQKKAFKISTNNKGQVLASDQDIHSILCVDFEEEKAAANNDSGVITPQKAQIQLESLPGASHVIYLDFDGEVVSGTRWVGGRTINAKPAGFSDEKILAVWRIMVDDFNPFNINVTTRRDVFDATPKNQRMMAIFTPTNDAAPGSGGVAYLNSFSWNSDDPCWVYNLGTRTAGETGSHEVGHTLGLRHDGTKSGTTYYSGHGQWSPIMGWSANKTLGHWSKGEYNDANNTENDLAIISNSRNGFGYKNDDHGNTINSATELISDSNGNVSKEDNEGIIEKTSDKDLFSFQTSGGEVNFSFDPNPYHPNLNIKARLLNSNSEEVTSSDPQGLKASISTTLQSGKYYIEIDGVGEGNLSTGYSDYSSLGLFSISGKYPKGNSTDTEAPSVPTNLSASNVEQTSLSLSWGASTDNVGVTGYDVYQGDVKITSVSGTSYNVTGLTANTTYEFRVKAKDAAGNTSGFSSTVSVTTKEATDTEAPSVPTSLSASNVEQTSLSLSWGASTDNVGVIGYDVYQGNVKITSVDGTSYNVTGLTANTTYEFRVKAKDAAGNTSGFSSTVSVTTKEATDTEAPSVPTSLSASNVEQTSLSLSWGASTDNVGVTGYDVYQGDVKITSVSGTSYNVTGLTANTTYEFRVKAKDAASASNVEQTSLSLSWGASTDNVGVTGYDVYQGNVKITSVNGTSYNVTGLTANTTYEFRVKAKDAAGNTSGFSNTVSVTTKEATDTEAPSVPTNLSASNVEQTSLSLSWGASTDNVGVTGYDVYQGNVKITSVNGTSYNVTGLTANTTYEFRVKAKDAAGNTSGFSNTVSVTTKEGSTTDICEGVQVWVSGVNYAVGDRVIYRSYVYERTDNGWIRLGRCDANLCEGVDTWVSGVRYNIGDQVVYRGNLWERGARRWRLVSSCSEQANKFDSAAPPQKMSVYPNPISGSVLNIVFNPSQEATYSIYNLLGETVSSGYFKSSVQVDHLPTGTYILKVTSDKTQHVTRFVKE